MEPRQLTKEENKEQTKLTNKPLWKFVYVGLLWLAVLFGVKTLFPSIEGPTILLFGLIILRMITSSRGAG